MSFLDDLAFGPSGGRKAWARGLLIALAALAAVAALLYYTVSGDYAFLRASVLTGSPTGAYHALGDRLAARALKKNGHLKVVATAGSVENIARLVGENGRCVPAFAFVQDGVPTPADAGLTTLGRLPQPESLFLLAQARARDQHLQRPQRRFGRDRSGRFGHGLSDAATAGEFRPQRSRLESRPVMISKRRRDLSVTANSTSPPSS